MRLSGKTAVVTGGASGIGASVCQVLAAEGARVAVVDRDADGTRRIAAGIPGALALPADVADSRQVDDTVAAVVAQAGGLDILVNAAGVDDTDAKARLAEHFSTGAPLDVTAQLTDEQWRRMMSINLDGVFYCMRAALRIMLPRQAGSIVNISSVGGVVGGLGMPHYSSAKAGVLGLTRSVAKEVADRGIRVNAIAPGTVRTPMFARSPKGIGGPVPMRRTAEPGEIATAVLFLVSDDASYITGETLNVNGGMVTV
ncbi:SDR family NAD(P)-dependent oxidoreductase [Dactylosporangium sp. CA-092794]|uniref:SDR family NAD(P)-dependent oxidoreductase n=1 Tax=Dactylosporangium sp. CA-092794 TaxID=3239929 RepID=UPI003D904448